VLAATALCILGYQAVGFDVPPLAFALYAATRTGHRHGGCRGHRRRGGSGAGRPAPAQTPTLVAIGELTNREREIVTLVARGLSRSDLPAPGFGSRQWALLADV
jgi:hypothetical protein